MVLVVSGNFLKRTFFFLTGDTVLIHYYQWLLLFVDMKGLILSLFFLTDNRVGIEIPKIEVRYRNLSVEGNVHVGSRALPTLFNVTLNTFEVFNFILFFKI